MQSNPTPKTPARARDPPDTAHNRQLHIMQSVFSLASPQIRRAACRELTGDAELKMDWTEPPTELNAMGFYSSCLVFGDDQIAAWTDGREILVGSIAVK